jgi:4-hydroxyphenylpyruvate dioxygenase-like putative hemolysin
VRVALDHVTAVVGELGPAARALESISGASLSPEIKIPGMVIRTLRLGDVELHVNAPDGPGPVKAFHDAHGAGLHHVALRVDDLDVAITALAALGLATLGAPVESAPGLREVFLDPARVGGLWVQLVERRGDVHASDLDAGAVARLAAQASR